VLTVVPGAVDADDPRRLEGVALIDEIVREGARRMRAVGLGVVRGARRACSSRLTNSVSCLAHDTDVVECVEVSEGVAGGSPILVRG
jgi:hypothetical protein